MIKNIVIFFIVVVCLSVGIEAKICRASTLKTVKVTITYTYSYLVTFYGECYYGNDCLLSRWETRVKNKTIERPDIELKYKCCPGWRDIFTNETGPNLVCVPDNSTLEINPTTYNATHNGTILEILRRFTTTTERPEYNDSVPYHRRYTNSTEILNNDTAPFYRRHTNDTESNYNATMPYYIRHVRKRHTTTTERNYNETVPSYPRYKPSEEWPHYGPVPDVPYNWRYTTSTERNNNGTGPFYRSYRRHTTSTERNFNDTVPYRWWNTTSTERNYNDTASSYRGYTTSTERNYNDTVPFRWWTTTSTERSYRRYTTTTDRPYYRTVPSYRWYTSSTERNNNDTVPYRWWTPTSTERSYRRYTTTTDRPYYRTVPSYRWYTTSTERNNNDTVPYRWWTPTSTERSYRRYTTTTDRPYFRTVPSYRRYTTSTERNNNDTVPYRWRYTTSTEEPTVLVGQRSSHLDEIEKTTTKYTWPIPIGSLPDIDEPYRPYNWNNTTYKIKPIDYNIPFTTVPVDTNETGKPMCPKQRWILILTSIILIFTALCVTLLVWRIILLKKYQVRERLVVDEGPKPEIQDMYNATYTSTETKAKINSIYPSTTDL